MAPLRLLLAIGCSWLAPAVGAAAPAPEEAWLDALYEDVARDLASGRPLVVQVHVPLCDNDIIRCGNAGLGDGDNPATNLYWATSGGFKGWFRTTVGWKQVERSRPARAQVLERIVWKRTVSPSRRWRKLGVRKPFDLYVVALAWRGQAIADAIDRYVADLYGAKDAPLVLPDGKTLHTGGAAHIVAYVGHNGWMDLPAYDWDKAARNETRRKKATIAVACLTADYLAAPIADRRRVPLLMTTSLLFAGAHSFEGAVRAFAEGGTLAQIRARAAESYARGQDKPFVRAHSAFTNPSDRRWQRYAREAE